MTQPLGQGTSTWARTTRLGELEWGMPRKKALAMFEDARVFPRYEGRNPRTGEPVIVRESVALPATPPPIPDLAVHPFVTFDDSDQLDSIILKSPYPRPETATDAQLLQAANKVLAALDAAQITALPKRPMKWTRKTTNVVFEWDDECFRFELSST